MIKHIVSDIENNKSIERILLQNYKIDRNSFFKALRQKDIKINGKRTNKNEFVKVNDVIEAYVYIKDTPDALSMYNIIYEDDFIIIVNKKQGIPVINDSNNELCLIDLINKNFNSNYQLCHRLDRNTGGLLIISKNNEFTEIIKNEINNRFYKKIYKCIVWGNACDLIGVHKAWLFKDNEKNIVYINNSKKKFSKEIITEIVSCTFDAKNNTSQLEINLLTGRTHQIRAHMAHLGHFVIGDGKYGVNEINKHFGYKFQALWASSLIVNSDYNDTNNFLPKIDFNVNPEYE